MLRIISKLMPHPPPSVMCPSVMWYLSSGMRKIIYHHPVTSHFIAQVFLWVLIPFSSSSHSLVKKSRNWNWKDGCWRYVYFWRNQVSLAEQQWQARSQHMTESYDWALRWSEMTAAPNAHSAQLELSDSRRANAMLIGTYRVAAASSTMPMFFLACHTKKSRKWNLMWSRLKGKEKRKKERKRCWSCQVITKSNAALNILFTPFRFLRYHSNRHLCIQNGAPSTDRNNFFSGD